MPIILIPVIWQYMLRVPRADREAVPRVYEQHYRAEHVGEVDAGNPVYAKAY